MGAAIQKQHPGAQIELKPGGRGDFVVTVDGQRVWDKRKQGDEFPDEADLVAKLKA